MTCPTELSTFATPCEACQDCTAEMPKYVTPKHSRPDITRAGKALVNPDTDPMTMTWALDVINNWRAAHAYPLNAIAMNLRNRARKRDQRAIVAQRLKRLTSIERKLNRFPSMRLIQMQDIGGCRAVVTDLLDVEDLIREYARSDTKSPHRHQRTRSDNYIEKPKPDGYRSVHMIYEYRSAAARTKVFNGAMIEIQIRSQLQHAWATAVETVDAFTGQALKSSAGSEMWARFFALMASALSWRERTPRVPGTPTDERELLHELRVTATKLGVRTKLEGWRAALKHVENNETKNAAAYILRLDTTARRLRIIGFTSDQMSLASEQYLAIEKEIEGRDDMQAVLVSVDSIASLPIAYPNYYSDTDLFLNALQFAIDQAHLL